MNVAITCLIGVALLLMSGCAQKDVSEIQKHSFVTQEDNGNQEYIEKFKEPCEALVRLKMEVAMKRNMATPYNEKSLDAKYKKTIANYQDEIKLFAKQEHMYLKPMKGLLSKQAMEKMEEVENSIYKDLQYDISTSANNNIITVAVSMRCVDDKAMAEMIEKNFRKRLQNAFPKQYKNDMWVQNLVDTASSIIPLTKKKIEMLNNRKWASQIDKLSKDDQRELDEAWNTMKSIKAQTTDEWIMIMFAEELIKAYRHPIYLSDKQVFHYNFVLTQERSPQGEINNLISSSISDSRVDINKMFWLGISSARNATRSESIDYWISYQWPWREYKY